MTTKIRELKLKNSGNCTSNLEDNKATELGQVIVSICLPLDEAEEMMGLVEYVERLQYLFN